MPEGWTPAVERTWTQIVGPEDATTGGAGTSLRPSTQVLTTPLPGEEAASFGPRALEAQQTAAERPAARHRRIGVERPRGRAEGETTGPAEIVLAESIGVGAMGEVYEAEQRSLRRTVAIKLMREGVGADLRAMQQFESEAIIAGRLDHPNIIPIHDLGVDADGRLAYFMKRVEGTPWSKLLRADAGTSISGRAVGSRSGKGIHHIRDHMEILLAVCDAVAFAHSRGYIHRDLKPENVIVGAYGEVQLIDWGLAVNIRPASGPDDPVSNLADTVITCGTPAYMPPETSLGLRDRVGPPSDVYALGAILFEIIYGRRLHQGKTVMDVIRAAGRNAWRVPPTVRDPSRPFHSALRPLLEKTLQTDVRLRPPDGAAFAIALREYLARIDSTALATRAHRALEDVRAERLDPGDTLIATRPTTPEARYRAGARVIARLEESLEKWPGNPDARAWLAEALLFQARQSVESGDLLSASSTLDDLRELPGSAKLPAEVHARIDGVRGQVQERSRIRARRQRVNRSLRFVAVGLLAVMLALVAGADVLMTRARDQARAERDALSMTVLEEIGDGLQRTLEANLRPAQTATGIAADLARRGSLDSDDPDALDAVLMPVVHGMPLVTSVVRADDDGVEYLVLERDDGWQTRLTRPGQPTVWREYDDQAHLRSTRSAESDYDPRERPWFALAREMKTGNDAGARQPVAWTAPYEFHSTGELGMSVVTVASGPAGRRFTIAFDVTLADLSKNTMETLPRHRGSVALLDGDGRVLGLPGDPRFDDPKARRDAVFEPVGALGLPLLAAAHERWARRGRKSDDVFDLETDERRYWAGAFVVEIDGAAPMWAFAVLPESGFLSLQSESTD